MMIDPSWMRFGVLAVTCFVDGGEGGSSFFAELGGIIARYIEMRFSEQLLHRDD